MTSITNTNVAIVGAGAAGLSAAYEFAIDGTFHFQVLEASTGNSHFACCFGSVKSNDK
jgi:2-polyprenyl-6-methoxyphenol hydroxylase-like FAD-dependent oxidoreductase